MPSSTSSGTTTGSPSTSSRCHDNHRRHWSEPLWRELQSISQEQIEIDHSLQVSPFRETKNNHSTNPSSTNSSRKTNNNPYQRFHTVYDKILHSKPKKEAQVKKEIEQEFFDDDVQECKSSSPSSTSSVSSSIPPHQKANNNNNEPSSSFSVKRKLNISDQKIINKGTIPRSSRRGIIANGNVNANPRPLSAARFDRQVRPQTAPAPAPAPAPASTRASTCRPLPKRAIETKSKTRQTMSTSTRSHKFGSRRPTPVGTGAGAGAGAGVGVGVGANKGKRRNSKIPLPKVVISPKKKTMNKKMMIRPTTRTRTSAATRPCPSVKKPASACTSTDCTKSGPVKAMAKQPSAYAIIDGGNNGNDSENTRKADRSEEKTNNEMYHADEGMKMENTESPTQNMKKVHVIDAMDEEPLYKVLSARPLPPSLPNSNEDTRNDITRSYTSTCMNACRRVDCGTSPTFNGKCDYNDVNQTPDTTSVYTSDFMDGISTGFSGYQNLAYSYPSSKQLSNVPIHSNALDGRIHSRRQKIQPDASISMISACTDEPSYMNMMNLDVESITLTSTAGTTGTNGNGDGKDNENGMKKKHDHNYKYQYDDSLSYKSWKFNNTRLPQDIDVSTIGGGSSEIESKQDSGMHSLNYSYDTKTVSDHNINTVSSNNSTSIDMSSIKTFLSLEKKMKGEEITTLGPSLQGETEKVPNKLLLPVNLKFHNDSISTRTDIHTAQRHKEISEKTQHLEALKLELEESRTTLDDTDSLLAGLI